MIQVNTLIQNAFQRTSLVGDGQSATGTQATAALNDLNSLIAELSTQNLLLSDIEQIDIANVDDKIVFGKVPDRVFAFDTFENMRDQVAAEIEQGNMQENDILFIEEPHNGYQYYWLRKFGPTSLSFFSTERFNKACKDLHLFPDVVVGTYQYNTGNAMGVASTLPDRIIGIGRKVGNRFVQLYPSNILKINSRSKCSLSTQFSSEYENRKFVLVDREYYFERFIITLDSNRQTMHRINYYEMIPELKLSDTLHVDRKYESLIEDGLCVKLCQRYKLMDIKADFEKDYDNQRILIKRINKANQPLVYDFVNGASWYDNVANGYGGTGWGE